MNDPHRMMDAFPPISDEDWAARIRQDLGSVDPEEVLHWVADGPLAMKAYFRSSDRPAQTAARTGRPSGARWEVREVLIAAECGNPGSAVLESLGFGVDGVDLIVRPADVASIWSELSNNSLVHWRCAGDQSDVLSAVESAYRANSRPVGGSIQNDLRPETKGLVHSLLGNDQWQNCRLCSVSVRSDLESIAALGLAFARLSDWFAAFPDQHPSRIGAAMHVLTEVNVHFFDGLARLRALRLGVDRIAACWGASDRIPIHATTAAWTADTSDPHRNLLRATTAGASAVIAGCDSLTVIPFDAVGGATDKGRRLARNVQHILREEGRLDRVADPSAGSYAIETQTERLATAAWALFQRIESMGGLRNVIGSAWLSDLLQNGVQA